METYLRVNLLGPGPRLMKKKKIINKIYLAAVSQRLRNTGIDNLTFPDIHLLQECSVRFNDLYTVWGHVCL